MEAETSYSAVPFQAPAGSEIMGKVVKSYFENLERDVVAPVLGRYNLEVGNINPDDWYPLQLYYDIDKEIYKDPNGSSALVAIGKATMANLLALLPYKTLEDYILHGLNSIATRSFIRNVPSNFGFIVTNLGHQHYRVKSNMPAPNESVFGSLWEACRLLKKENESFTVTPVEGYPGNDVCATLEIRWG